MMSIVYCTNKDIVTEYIRELVKRNLNNKTDWCSFFMFGFFYQPTLA